MKKINILLAASLLAQSAMAEQFDYEAGLTYQHAEQDVLTTLNGGSQRQASDSDSYALVGTWYFAGLSDDAGPLALAAFLSRASSLSGSYGQDETDSEFASQFLGGINQTGPGTSLQTSSLETDWISASARYVWKQSGWYGLASVSHAESKSSFQSVGMPITRDFDSTSFSVGGGKYLGKSTAVDFTVASLDTGAASTTSYSLALDHVGALGPTWQYALDAIFSRSDADGDHGNYGIGWSVFPTNALELGIALTYSDSKFAGGESYAAVASWFIIPNVGLSASYIQNELDTRPFTDVDSNRFSLGVRVRL